MQPPKRLAFKKAPGPNRQEGSPCWGAVPRYRVPFARVSPGEEPEAFDPGPVLARIVDEDLLADAGASTAEGSIKTPWGSLGAERRDVDEVFLETPEAEVSARQVMLAVAVRELGVERASVEAALGAIQGIDVGEAVLVVPLEEVEDVQTAPAEADPGAVVGVDAEGGIAYAVMQTSPYARIRARLWGEVAPMTALAAAAMHLVMAEGFRVTYPRTRVVGQLVGVDDEAEVTVQAREAGAGPVVERVLVGGTVERAE